MMLQNYNGTKDGEAWSGVATIFYIVLRSSMWPPHELFVARQQLIAARHKLFA